jgi:HSP20 family protein
MAQIIRRTTPERAHLSQLDPFRDMTTWSPFVAPPLAAFAPQFEVKETKDAFIFKADLPGVDEENIEVTLAGNRLTISGFREEEDRLEGENFFAYERAFGNFTRAFTLPDGVDSEHVSAELKDGVLTIQVPKKPEHQPKKILLKVAEKVKSVLGKEKGRAHKTA